MVEKCPCLPLGPNTPPGSSVLCFETINKRTHLLLGTDRAKGFPAHSSDPGPQQSAFPSGGCVQTCVSLSSWPFPFPLLVQIFLCSKRFLFFLFLVFLILFFLFWFWVSRSYFRQNCKAGKVCLQLPPFIPCQHPPTSHSFTQSTNLHLLGTQHSQGTFLVRMCFFFMIVSEFLTRIIN